MGAIAIWLGRLVALSVILFAAVLDAVPALAHGGPVQLGAGPDGAGGLTVFASYVEDGHPARGLALTATATDGGAGRGPLALQPAGEGEGYYVLAPGALPPGHWTVTVTGDAAQQVRPVTITVHVAPAPSVATPAGLLPSVAAPAGLPAPANSSGGTAGAGLLPMSAVVVGAFAAAALLGVASVLIVRRQGLRSSVVGRWR